jgi:hypothetical protein
MNIRVATGLLMAPLMVLALGVMAFGCMVLAWPDVTLAGQPGCFGSWGLVDRYLWLPVQAHPLTSTIVSGAALGLLTGLLVWSKR